MSMNATDDVESAFATFLATVDLPEPVPPAMPMMSGFTGDSPIDSPKRESIGESPVKPLIIGIAGGTGSGKSTVARNVAKALSTSSVAFIDMDGYYRNFAHVPFE